ncbi:cationic amino acid transporter, putative [Ricinus communis]|uniref:Cationic amino acid transporter, putative n=1 Tax=Ricinus communis TaxID=3988 RepID=B9RBC2_RICCO|nr:cationic amino acid transporter, putative [Ricinus communis]
MAEETKNPARDIPIGLVGSMIVVALAYCLLAAVLCLMVPYRQIDHDAAFSVALVCRYELVQVRSCLGCAARYDHCYACQSSRPSSLSYTHCSYSYDAAMVHSFNEKTGTPVNATVVMIIATAIVAFFTKMDILANLLSISTLFIFMLVAVALLVRRYYVTGEFHQTDYVLNNPNAFAMHADHSAQPHTTDW